MRQLKFTGITLLILAFGLMTFAQNDEAVDVDNVISTPTAQETLELAQSAIDKAESLNDLAFNLLGIFEAVSVAITIVAGGVGVFGFGRLLSAESNLNAAREEVQREITTIREQFYADLDQRRQEFDTFTSTLTKAVDDQRREAVNATLATALLSFGERQYKASDYIGSVNTYQRALELDTNNPVTYYRLGYVYTQQGDLDSAEENLQKSLAIDSAFAPAIVALGYVFRRKGEKMEEGIEREQCFNQAEKYMLEGLKISPKLIDDDGESWWGSLGGLYRRRGQTSQAIYAYEQAMGVTPHSSYPFGNLATLYGRENKVDDMLRMYKRVEKLAQAEVQAEVDNYWGYFDLLTAQLATGHTQKAEDNLPSVIETVPPDAVYALESLVDTLRRVGGYLEGHPQSEQMNRFANRIERYILERKANPSMSPMGIRINETEIDEDATDTIEISRADIPSPDTSNL